MAKTINPNIKPYIILVAILIGVAILLFCSGCGELRHYHKVQQDFPRNQEKRNILAQIMKVEFPAENRKDSSSTTTTVIVKDSAAESLLRARIDELAAKLAARPDCPQINKDSLFDAIKAQIKPEIRTTIKTEKVIETKFDSVGMVILQSQYGQLLADYHAKENEVKDRDEKIKKLQEEKQAAVKYKWMFWLAVVLGVVGIAGSIKFL